MRDRFFDRRLFAGVPAEQREAAIDDSLPLVEAGARDVRQVARRAPDAVLRRLVQLAEAPTSSTARSAVVAQGRRSRRSSTTPPNASTEATHRPTPASARRIDEINASRAQIASLNERIASLGRERRRCTLKDEQTDALKKLSSSSTSRPPRTTTAPCRCRSASARRS